MTAPVMITVCCDNSTTEIEVRAWLTPTPGLVVTPGLGADGWAVVHQRSGLLVGLVDDPESAQAMAVELAPIADWTVSGEELHRLNVGPRAKLLTLKKGRPASGIVGVPIDRNVLA